MSLKKAASEVRHNAYAPYSNFKVGAALRGKGGAIYTGVNVENVAYPGAFGIGHIFHIHARIDRTAFAAQGRTHFEI